MKSTNQARKYDKKFNTVVVAAALVIGFIGGYFLPGKMLSESPKVSEMNAADVNATANSQMTHGQLNVTDAATAPTIVLKVEPDKKSGYNVHVETTNFTFTPENASLEHVMNQGHAHLYINGEKIVRMYGPWFHIAALEPGENEIRVTLNANDHKDYAIEGKTIEDTATVIVSEKEHDATPHSH